VLIPGRLRFHVQFFDPDWIGGKQAMSVSRKPETLLLVEDDAGHALLIEKNLRRAGVTEKIVVLEDGKKAVDYLLKQGSYAALPDAAPALVLLDLNLPVLTGYQVLKIIRSDERTKKIPVAVLTTTDNPAEASRCRELGCDLYITKPVEYDLFYDAIHRISLLLSAGKSSRRA
jgi:CheY-like chemotaxis protein